MYHYFVELVSPNNLPNLLLFVAAVGALAVGVRTLLAIERQTKAAQDGDRGWVMASVAGNPEEPLTGNLIKGIRPGIVWQLEVVGNTPVRIIRTDLRCRIVDSDPIMVFQPWLEPTPVYLPNQAPEGQVVSSPGQKQLIVLTIEDLADPQPNVTLTGRLAQLGAGFGFFVSYGRVEYEDAFKRKGITQFCAIYRSHSGGVIKTPDGTVLNPVGFHIGGPPAYNFNT
jgi:hypothetical protein